MRKVNSKANLNIQQPSIQISSLSPNTHKQQSMIQLYKDKSQTNIGYMKPSTGKNPTSIISKTIQGRRQNMNVQNRKSDKSAKDLLDTNVSAQSVKPARLFSPGITILRKNETIIGVSSGRDKSPNINMFQIAERNPRQFLSKDKSVKNLVNATQRLTKNASMNNLAQTNQRQIIRRGAKFNGSGNADNTKQNQTMNQMFKSTFNLTRNKSQYLTLNPTHKISNYTTIDLKQNNRDTSPCISSEEEDTTPYKPQDINKKGSHMPNGSFIEKKMQNCLQSRNSNQDQVFQTHSGTQPINTQRYILQKNMSQPSLKSEAITQRNNPTKTSVQLRGQQDSKQKLSNMTQLMKGGFKGDLKSLTLSPIIPQNNNQSQRCDSSDYKTMATTQKRLNLDSIKKNYATQKDKDAEPTTEKKGNVKHINIKTMKQRPGYCSQETEKAPGGTHSFSTAEEFQVSTCEFRKHISNEELPLRQIKNQTIVPSKQQETVIKVTQILNNNKMNNNKRYNLAITPEYAPSSVLTEQQQATNKTPKAIPYCRNDSNNKNKLQIYDTVNDDDKTQKKDQNKTMTFDQDDEDDNELNSKDFDEFAQDEQLQEELQEKHNPFADQHNILKDITINNNLVGHNHARNAYYHTSKEDRNSTVNYDNSLLTHNTFRENHQSPLTQMRQKQAQDQKENQHPQVQNTDNFQLFLTQSNSSFIVPNTDGEENLTKEFEMNKTEDDLLSEDENGVATINKGKRQALNEMDSKYKAFLIKVQKEEESTIQNLTKQIQQSGKYKSLQSMKAKEKYLASNIDKVRKQFKQLLIDKIFNQAVYK